MTLQRILLAPFGWLYGGVMEVRNLLFKKRILKQAEFDIPVISIGNLAVGGTGKTPFTKYLIKHYSSSQNVAVLSRGYGRRTKGYRVVNPDDDPGQSGDEPLEIKRSYPSVVVCVCEDRVLGIAQMIHEFPEIELILLDDAFQHQYVLPSCSILLSRASNPFYRDAVLPAGRLREFRHNWRRADMVVYTSAEETWQPKRSVNRPTFLAFNRYGALRTMNGQPSEDQPHLLITGIASSSILYAHLNELIGVSHHISLPDHHRYTESELRQLQQKYPNYHWITTEKDWVKIGQFAHQLDAAISVIPMTFQVDNEALFFATIDQICGMEELED
ncbi:MAG: tetraacyldisaccharide 4'-kinase [Bacteroidetes bacterium]|nr:tetraacyldisaccharide 4'-kinase [Bacteroidota bacterium]